MPRAVIKSVDVNNWSEVVVLYEVFKDDGARWEEIWLTLSMEEYSAAEVDRRIRLVLERLKQIEAAKSNPAAPTNDLLQAELVNKEIVV